MDSNTPSAPHVSNGLWNECCLAFEFLNSGVREVLFGGEVGPKAIASYHEAGWWRALAWLSTLTRTVSPADYQAVFTAARALLEIATDAVLLHHEPDAPAKLADWEDSAKLKQAEAIERYFNGGDIPERMQPAVGFAVRQRARVVAARTARGWLKKGKPNHPDRWTTRNLGEDVRAADKFEPEMKLEEVYETEYRQMCWAVHASGAIGVRHLDAEGLALFGGQTFRVCSRLAERYARLLLRCTGAWENPYLGGRWADHFQRLEQMQALTVAATIFRVEGVKVDEDAFVGNERVGDD